MPIDSILTTAIHEALRLGMKQLHEENQFEDVVVVEDARYVPGTLIQDSMTGKTLCVVALDWEKLTRSLLP
jgi:hypothetical protein